MCGIAGVIANPQVEHFHGSQNHENRICALLNLEISRPLDFGRDV